MKKNTYMLLSKFKCCGKVMVTVIIKRKAACVMDEAEYNKFINATRGIEEK